MSDQFAQQNFESVRKRAGLFFSQVPYGILDNLVQATRCTPNSSVTTPYTPVFKKAIG